MVPDSVRVSCPCGQLSHQTNNPRIQSLVCTWLITRLFIECQLMPEEITPLHKGSLEAGVRSQHQSSPSALIDEDEVRPVKGRAAAMMQQSSREGTAQEVRDRMHG